MDGVLVIDKPGGLTSHDVVAAVRRITRERRTGHTGTLDPMATGVLPLVLGRATRLARFLAASVKRYEATVVLGIATDTFDAAGTAVGGVRLTSPAAPLPSEADVRDAVARFHGTFAQAPPTYSAKKVDGVPAHRLARRGTPAESLAPVEVTVHELTVQECEGARVRLALSVSAGFYVRSLAHDLGRALGCGAHLAALRRTASGEFDLRAARPLAGLDAAGAERSMIPLESLLPSAPAVRLTARGAVRAEHGNTLQQADALDDQRRPGQDASGPVRLLAPDGRLIGIAASRSGAPLWPLHPSVVLA
jgi:tRNA pseudouridine55 synthase